MPLMGSEFHHPADEGVLSLLADSGADVARYNGVVWYVVEPQQGERYWERLSQFDVAVRYLEAQGIDLIAVVRGTPGWAQKRFGVACGPIAAGHFADFAAFMQELVRRYPSVRYWELGNEPDVDPALVQADSVFGCWGDRDAPYYGGAYYAEMLKTVYPAIKEANPQAQVLLGGLLLDCDPDNPPEGADCASARFFEGVLAGGGAPFFDAVSFHGYPPYSAGSLWMDTFYPGWAARGGVVSGKIAYLRAVMQRYGVEKPLFHTESSLLCPEWNAADCLPPGEPFLQAQAGYVLRLLTRNWALGVEATIWYDFEGPGWRYASLVGADASNPKPAFRAFRFLRRKLAGMTYVGEISPMEGVQGYAFAGPEHTTWVVWPADVMPPATPVPQELSLPPGLLYVYDALGQDITPLNFTLTVTAPVYIDWIP